MASISPALKKVVGTDPNAVSFTVQGASGQVSDIFDVLNHAGTKMFSVDPSGNVVFPGSITFNDTFTSSLTVDGTMTVSGSSVLTTLSVSGASTFTGAASFQSGATFNNGIQSYGSLNANGQVNVNGTMSIPSFTKGSIPFIGTNGVLSQNNVDLFWDNTNNRMGIGTNAPSVFFHAYNANSNVALTDMIKLEVHDTSGGVLNDSITLSVGATNTRGGKITFHEAGGAFSDQYLQFLLNELRFVNVGEEPITFYTNNTERARFTGSMFGLNVTPTATLHIVQVPIASGTHQTILATPGANAGLTASTEFNQFQFNGSTQSWATGALANQRYFVVGVPTYAFTGASTLTAAVNVNVAGIPQAGSNATITEGIGLFVGSTSGNELTNVTGTSTQMLISQHGIATGVGNVTGIQGLYYGALNGGTVNLGDQTANLTTLNGVRLDQVTYTSTTNTRTVTGDVATLYIVGAPVASTNVTFSGTAYAFKVNSGTSFFGGNLELLSTGVKIATATTQKLAFWNKTPIVQPTTSITGASTVLGVGSAVQDVSTFGGYTIAQIAAALINVGILA